MKTKLLVPGSSLTQVETNTGEFASFVATDWLRLRPHVLLWADEILMAKNDFEEIHSQFKDATRRKTIRLVFDKLKENRIIKTFNPSSVVPLSLNKLIEKQVEEDEVRWKIEKPLDSRTGKVDMTYIRFGDIETCPYRLHSIYSSLAFAQLLDSQCLFDTYEYKICKKRFAETQLKNTILQQNPFQETLNIFAPNFQILSKYIWCEHTSTPQKNCGNCKHMKTCTADCIEETECNLNSVLELRQTDEMTELKRTILDVMKKMKTLKTNAEISEQEYIKMEIQKRIQNCKYRLLNTFPRVERWANITTAMSVPIAFAGAASANTLVSLLGCGALGLSQIVTETMKYLQSKYRWVAFLDKIMQVHPKAKSD